jgi:hypothetical protein
MDRMFVGRLEIPETVQGVIVARVDPTGAARQVLRRGFVILEVMAEYQRIVGAARTGDALAIYYFDPTVGQRSLVTVVVD